MKCQHCGYDNPDNAQHCGLCAELFRRPDGNALTGAAAPRVTEDNTPKPVRTYYYELIMFLAGLAAYPLVHAVCLLDAMCVYLQILIHELGHSLVFLAFGQIAIPKLDFVYGGGWSVPITAPGKAGPIVIMGLLILAAYLNRQQKARLILLGALTAIYPFLAFSKAQDILVSAGGHLCEALGAGICFYRCIVPAKALSFERPVYAVLGWWLTIQGVIFCWGLGTNASARTEYLADPIRYHDLARISDSIGWNFELIAVMFGIAYSIPVLLGIFLLVSLFRSKMEP